MKIKKSIVIAILTLLAACGGSTSPGTGPAFPATMKATTLWAAFAVEPYLPNELDNSNLTTGSANCENGGKASISGTQNSGNISADITYDDCVPPAQLSEFSTFKQNGTIHAEVKEVSSSVTTFHYINHISYSGDIGFAEDCDFTLTFESTPAATSYRFDGECTYTDSKGKTLKITGDQMNSYVNG